MRTLALALALLIPGPLWAGEIMVSDAYARLARPGAPTAAVFMTFHNIGADSDRLIGAASPAARLAQLHTHIEEGGVMKMRELKDGVPLPGGETVTFERGGDHVMLMGLTEKLVDGATLSLTLTFEGAGDVTIEVPVDNQRGQATRHKH